MAKIPVAVMAAYFDNPNFSDVTIKFSGREIRAHKVILSIQSQYFRSAFNPEHNFKEATEQVMELKDDDVEAVEAMIKWMYTFEFALAPEDDSAPWEKYLDLYMVAEKYGLERTLGDEASSKLLHVLAHAPCSSIVQATKYVIAHGRDPCVVNRLLSPIRWRLQELLGEDEFRQLLEEYPKLAIKLLIKDS